MHSSGSQIVAWCAYDCIGSRRICNLNICNSKVSFVPKYPHLHVCSPTVLHDITLCKTRSAITLARNFAPQVCSKLEAREPLSVAHVASVLRVPRALCPYATIEFHYPLNLPLHLSFHPTHYLLLMPSDAELANQALTEENTLRFHSFSSSDAITLGLSIRKRFRASSRHAKGKGIIICIETVGGHTLFACTVGDLGAGMGDVSMDSWCCVKGMIKVVNRTGHSSFYVEKGMAAIGKTPDALGIPFPEFRVNGGAFPIWLENAPCCPIAVVAAYGGSSQEDHHLVAATIRDYLTKLSRGGMTPGESQR